MSTVWRAFLRLWPKRSPIIAACINVAVALDPIPPEELILIGMDPFA
jgi:lambda repressor-like predicted transcriptional regulator